MNVLGYWITSSNSEFYRLNQSGSKVTGEYYYTLGGQALGIADYVYECGLLSGQVNGRTLSIELIRTPQNCPTNVDAGREIRVTISGEVRGDSFSGDVTLVIVTTVGGIEQIEETLSYSTR